MTFRTEPSIRFWSKVDKKGPNDCWNWTSSKNRAGYGTFCLGGRHSFVLAHRFSYSLHNGEIAKEMCCLHTCDNPSCVNPNHLYVGDRQDNANDKVLRNRCARSAGELNPFHKLTQSQVEEIRRLYVFGSKENGLVSLAKKYGVGRQTIHNVISGKTWGKSR